MKESITFLNDLQCMWLFFYIIYFVKRSLITHAILQVVGTVFSNSIPVEVMSNI